MRIEIARLGEIADEERLRADAFVGGRFGAGCRR